MPSILFQHIDIASLRVTVASFEAVLLAARPPLFSLEIIPNAC